MSTLFADTPCVDPAPLRAACVERGLPVDWYGKPNAFRVPLGRGPGAGHVLLTREALDDLDLAADHELTFLDDEGNERTLRKITLVRAVCVTPGAEDDPAAAYLCDLEDRRRHLARIPLNKAYNVRSRDGESLLTPTKNGSDPWTWEELVADLWEALGVDDPPELPFEPDGDPGNLVFWGGWAWEALCSVLDRLACAVKYDPEADTFEILRLGDLEAEAAKAAQAARDKLDKDGLRTWDGYWLEPDRGRLPEKVRVLFPRRPQPADGTPTLYAVDVTLAAAAGVVPGTFEVLHDDLAAVGTGTPTNAADLTARANERAADWRRKRVGFEARTTVVYRDFQAAPTLLGNATGRAAYDDRGGAMGTEIGSGPDGAMEKWRPWDMPWGGATIDDLDDALSAAVAACDKLFGLTAADCPTFTVAYRGGACAQVPFQSGSLAFDPTVSTAAGMWTWVAEASFRTDPSDPEDDESSPTLEGFLQLTVKGGPKLVLVEAPGGTVLYDGFEWVGCRDGKWRFVGLPDGACSGEAVATCGDNTFAIDIDCGACTGVTCGACSFPKRLCLTFALIPGQSVPPDLQGYIDTYGPTVTVAYDHTQPPGDPTSGLWYYSNLLGSGNVRQRFRLIIGCSDDTPTLYLTMSTNGGPAMACGGLILSATGATDCDLAGTFDVLHGCFSTPADPYVFATLTVAPVPADGCRDSGSAGGGNGDGGGDSCDNATGIGCDDAVSVTVPAGQSRWFKVTVPSGKTADLTATFSPAPTGVGMRLWDAADIPECPPQPPGGDAALPVGPGTPEVTMSVAEGVYFVELVNPGPETTATLAVACQDVTTPPTYDCVDGACVLNPDGIGEFDSPEECAESCGGGSGPGGCWTGSTAAAWGGSASGAVPTYPTPVRFHVPCESGSGHATVSNTGSVFLAVAACNPDCTRQNFQGLAPGNTICVTASCSGGYALFEILGDTSPGAYSVAFAAGDC